MEASATYEWCQFFLDLFVARLFPIDRGVIHLVNDDDDLVDAGGLDKHDMLASLSALFEARLKFAFPGGDDEECNVCLRGAGNHRRHVRLVTWSIQDRVPPCGGLKVRSADLDRLALGSLLGRRVERPGEVPTLPAGILGLTLVLLHRAFVDHPA